MTGSRPGFTSSSGRQTRTRPRRSTPGCRRGFRWKRVTDALGLPEDATPSQAKAQVACIDGFLVGAHDAAEALRRRIGTIEKDQEQFARDARELRPRTRARAERARPHRDRRHPPRRGIDGPWRSRDPRSVRPASAAPSPIDCGRSRAARRRHETRSAGLPLEPASRPAEIEKFCETTETRIELRAELEHAVTEIEAAGAQPVAALESHACLCHAGGTRREQGRGRK